MSLIDLDIELVDEILTESIQELIAEAHRRIDRFLMRRAKEPVAGFVASDFELAHSALKTTSRLELATGRKFCEWGSGFGVVATMASLLGFDACGIEVDEELVNEARSLAEDFGADVEFVQGSLIPEGAEVALDANEDFHWLDSTADGAYDELQLEVDDFDIVYAYPWPGEEQVIEQIFDRHAAVGAILITFHGSADLRMLRKTRAKRRR
jgi:hypothetical protein